MTGPAESGSDDRQSGYAAESRSGLTAQPSALKSGPPDSLPMPVFLDFLRRLHDGPPQHAAAVRVALAVWQQAVIRGDVVQAQAALEMVRGEMDRLVSSISALQELGRRWSGHESPTHQDLANAARTAEDWDRRLTHGPHAADG